jgi:Cys-tRNA(Pro) deacylase
MADASKIPVTPATRMLRSRNVDYTCHLYRYEEHGGTRVSARELGVDEHAMVKTLIMEDEAATPLVVLMHGDREVSTKALARQIGCKTIQICAPEVATKHSGYLVGGTSPFGTRKPMRVCMERTILELAKIYVNGGRRGFLVGLDPKDVTALLQPTLVDAGR